MQDKDWSQKYRPSSIEDVILPKKVSQSVLKIVKNRGGLPLLFHGRPGCGKTTVAKLINPANTLYINGTCENSVNMVRELERKCAPLTLDGGRRLVLLDEADYLSKDAQAALRGTVETLSVTNDFVMTANEYNKLIDPLLSRFYSISFEFENSKPAREKMAARLRTIAESEGYRDVSDQQLTEIVDFHFPDMRRMVKTLQYQLQFPN